MRVKPSSRKWNMSSCLRYSAWSSVKTNHCWEFIRSLIQWCLNPHLLVTCCTRQSLMLWRACANSSGYIRNSWSAGMFWQHFIIIWGFQSPCSLEDAWEPSFFSRCRDIMETVSCSGLGCRLHHKRVDVKHVTVNEGLLGMWRHPAAFWEHFVDSGQTRWNQIVLTPSTIN